MSIYEYSCIFTQVLAVYEDLKNPRKACEIDEDEIESLDEVENAIQESIDWLHRLSNSIRKASSFGQNKRAKDYRLLAGTADEDSSGIIQGDVAPQLIKIYTLVIKRDYPALGEVLRRRLAQSIVMRRKQIMYRQSRNEEWAIQQESHLQGTPKRLQPPQPTSGQSFPRNNKKEGTETAEHLKVARTQLTATTIQPEKLKGTGALSTISHAVTTPLRKEDRKLTPLPPQSTKTGKDFVCPYCCTILKAAVGLDAKQWS